MGELRGYVVLTNTRTWLSRTIQLYTKFPYNHASIALDPELREVYSFGRKRPRNPFIGGFVKENLKEEYFLNADCEIYSFPITKIQKQKVNWYIQDFQKQKDDYRYNFIGLLGFLMKKPLNRPNAFFCTQFVATVLQENDIFEYEKPLELITPMDLKSSPQCRLIYKGRLRDYLLVNENEPLVK